MTDQCTLPLSPDRNHVEGNRRTELRRDLWDDATSWKFLPAAWSESICEEAPLRRRIILEEHECRVSDIPPIAHLEPPTASSERVLEQVFQRLAQQWRRETGHLSSITATCVNDAYQRIIGLGPQVIPVILRELEREPDHWFWALSALTGENPIQDEHAGDLPKMSEDWIEFGKERGYL